MKASLLKVMNCIIALTGCLALLGYASPSYAGDVPDTPMRVAGTLPGQVQQWQTVKPSIPGAVQFQDRIVLPGYPDSGSGPLPNVANWFPTGKNHQGGTLRIRGSNLSPNNTYAYVGSVRLNPGTIQNTNEISFKIPDGLNAPEGRSLAVFIKGGQVRTLENSYRVYPMVSITGVYPTTFKQGTRVTMRGTGFQALQLQEKYSTKKVSIGQMVYDSSTLLGDFVIIDFGNSISYAKSALITNPFISANGDTLEFTVGALYEHLPVNSCGSSAGCFTISMLSPMSPLPASLLGTLEIYTCGGFYIKGPAVTWQP